MVSLAHRKHRRCGEERRLRRRRIILAVAGGIAVEAAGLWVRTGRIGGHVIVRCRRGHPFTTIWIPGASLKSLRLGWWRYQRCPVGGHWSLVTPVSESELSEDERHSAREWHDINIP